MSFYILGRRRVPFLDVEMLRSTMLRCYIIGCRYVNFLDVGMLGTWRLGRYSHGRSDVTFLDVGILAPCVLRPYCPDVELRALDVALVFGREWVFALIRGRFVLIVVRDLPISPAFLDGR